MKTLTAIIFDTFFTAGASFVLLIIFLSYFFKPPTSIIFSAILAILFALLFLKLSKDKNLKEKLTRAEKNQKDIMLSQLKLYTPLEQNDFLEKVLKSYGKAVERKNDGLFIKDSKYVLFSFFSYDEIKKSDIVKAFNSISKLQTAVVLAESFPLDVQSFIERFDGRIKMLDGDKLYSLLKEKDILPKVKHVFLEKKRLDLSIFKNLLKKKKAKNFLLFGLIFVLTSYFTPIKLFYLICGSIFIVFSLFLHFYGKDEKPKNN